MYNLFVAGLNDWQPICKLVCFCGKGQTEKRILDLIFEVSFPNKLTVQSYTLQLGIQLEGKVLSKYMVNLVKVIWNCWSKLVRRKCFSNSGVWNSSLRICCWRENPQRAAMNLCSSEWKSFVYSLFWTWIKKPRTTLKHRWMYSKF